MKRFRFLPYVGLVALVILGCGGSSTTAEVPDPVIRFINASPTATAVDMSVNETQLGNNVGFMGSSPNFVSFDPGEYDIAVQQDGDPDNYDIEVYTMNADQSYISLAIGILNPVAEETDKRLRPVTFQMDRLRPNGDKARLIVVHAYVSAEGTQTPGIDFQNPGDNPRIRETNIAFGGARGILVDSGSNTFVARRTGSEEELFTPVTTTFEAGKIYAAVVSGLEGGANPPTIRYVELQSR